MGNTMISDRTKHLAYELLAHIRAGDPTDPKGYSFAVTQEGLEVLERALMTSPTPSPAGGSDEPIAWIYELAYVMRGDKYSDWRERITKHKPNVPEGSIRNLRPLYAASPTPPTSLALETGEEDTQLIARFEGDGYIMGDVSVKAVHALFSRLLSALRTEAETIEACAKIAEQKWKRPRHPSHIAADIRALKPRIPTSGGEK
jgi:hypothetical protein